MTEDTARIFIYDVENPTAFNRYNSLSLADFNILYPMLLTNDDIAVQAAMVVSEPSVVALYVGLKMTDDGYDAIEHFFLTQYKSNETQPGGQAFLVVNSKPLEGIYRKVNNFEYYEATAKDTYTGATVNIAVPASLALRGVIALNSVVVVTSTIDGRFVVDLNYGWDNFGFNNAGLTNLINFGNEITAAVYNELTGVLTITGENGSATLTNQTISYIEVDIAINALGDVIDFVKSRDRGTLAADDEARPGTVAARRLLGTTFDTVATNRTITSFLVGTGIESYLVNLGGDNWAIIKIANKTFGTLVD